LFSSRPGCTAHRVAGRVFAVLMAITATTTVFIQSLFGFALTAHGLWSGIRAIRAGEIECSRPIMRRLRSFFV